MRVTFIIPARNEEKNLENCIKSLYYAVKNLKIRKKTFICLNECTDNTFSVASRCIRKYKGLNITLLKSQKGKLNAQNMCVKHTHPKSILIFLDADVELEKNSIKIILEEFKKHKSLIAVGGFPVAKKYNGKNPWKKFLDKILNIRSRHPKCEVALHDVKEYHPFALKNPQFVDTDPEHELRSKIYFHGRLFGIRSKKYWKKPKNNKIVGDDSFLPDYITYKCGKGRIRIRYDALVYYSPYTSLIDHFKTYKRIYFDLKNLKKIYPEFRKIREDSTMILDFSYIKKQNLKTKIQFLIFTLIRKIEKILFEISGGKDPKIIWK